MSRSVPPRIQPVHFRPVQWQHTGQAETRDHLHSTSSLFTVAMTFTLGGIIIGAGIGAYIGSKIDSSVEENLSEKERRRIKAAFGKLGVDIPNLEKANEDDIKTTINKAKSLSEEKKDELGREIDEILDGSKSKN